MAESEQEAPIGMVALRLHRASEADFFARLGAAGYHDLRMRHSMLFDALESGGTRVSTLAARLGMSPQAMGELVDDLEASGYIERQNDPNDRRARLVVFTTKGEVALQRSYEIIAGMEEDYAAIVGKQRLASARETLTELLTAVEAPEQTS
jgi:DNA-binding MarR family transcriptional regulator